MRNRLAALVVALIALPAAAKFMVHPDVPVERLITNTTAYIKEHPDDAMGPYTLARIHYFALALNTDQIKAMETDGGKGLVSIRDMFNPASDQPGKLTTDQLLQHFNSAVENFQKAISMDDKNGLFHLGLASVVDSAIKAKLKLPAFPGDDGKSAADSLPAWTQLAIAEYRKAYDLSIANDLTIRNLPLQGIESIVSYESATNYVTMVTARGVKEGERVVVEKMNADIQTLRKKPMGPITPIIFSLDRARPMDQLLDSSHLVSFDLDGTARPQRYAWVGPNTGILVWDPHHTGVISCGQQLFGSVSLDMLWSDGYRALDALDDNRDGKLSGRELEGLAIWFDRNGDGISQKGEVMPIEQAGIREISVRKTGAVPPIIGKSELSPANGSGLLMEDGRILPTYDWTTKAKD